MEKANVIDAIKWCGHNRLTFIGDAQVFARLDAAVRALATDQWYVLSRRDFYEDEDGRPRPWWRLLFRKKPQHRVIRTEWTFLWIKNQMKVQAAELRTLGEVIDTAEYVRKCKFVYYGNIYERYNSESGRAYWLKGIIDYYVEEHRRRTPGRHADAESGGRLLRTQCPARRERREGGAMTLPYGGRVLLYSNKKA